MPPQKHPHEVGRAANQLGRDLAHVAEDEVPCSVFPQLPRLVYLLGAKERIEIVTIQLRHDARSELRKQFGQPERQNT